MRCIAPYGVCDAAYLQSFAKRLTKRKNRNSETPPNLNFYNAQCNAFIPNNKPKMPARLPDDVIYRIQLRLECGENPAEIYKATKVSISTIQRVRLNLDLFGQPYTPSTVVLGRPKALLPAQELVMSMSNVI